MPPISRAATVAVSAAGIQPFLRELDCGFRDEGRAFSYRFAIAENAGAADWPVRAISALSCFGGLGGAFDDD